MKKIILLLVFSVSTGLLSFGQYFQATFTNTGNVLSFKMRPTATITTAGITYIEVAFRYTTLTTPSFTILNITSNTTNFPGLNMQKREDYIEGSYTYVRFVYNTGTIPGRTYAAGTELEFLTITLDANPPALANFTLASNLNTVDPNNYYFAVIDGPNFLDPGAGNQLYGPGFFISGVDQLVPLVGVPVPVKFTGFTVTKKNDNALLNWQIENENDNSDHYEVERSTNGSIFKTVKTITPRNNGSTANNYEATDINISGLRSSPVLYYRIKQVDKDGKALYTETKSIRLSGKGFAASIYPNPVKTYASLAIDLLQDEKVSVRIMDAGGKLVKRLELQGKKGFNLEKIDLSTIAPGNYLLQARSVSAATTLSLIKIN